MGQGSAPGTDHLSQYSEIEMMSLEDVKGASAEGVNINGSWYVDDWVLILTSQDLSKFVAKLKSINNEKNCDVTTLLYSGGLRFNINISVTIPKTLKNVHSDTHFHQTAEMWIMLSANFARPKLQALLTAQKLG